MTLDMVLTFASRLFTMATAFVASILTARFLGPESRGEYFLIVTYAATIVQFSNLGLHSCNSYMLAKDPTLLEGLLANSLYISVIFGGIVAAGATVVCQGLSVLRVANLADAWLGAMLVVPSLFWMLGSNLLLGMHSFRTYNLLQAVSSAALLSSLVLCRVLELSVTGYLLAVTLAWTALSLALALVLARGRRQSLRFRWDLLAGGVRYAAKAFTVCLLGYLAVRLNVFILNRSAGEAEMGQFSIASQMGDAMGAIPLSVATVLFPHLVRHQGTRWNNTCKSLLVVAALMLAACGAIAFLARPFIRLAYGERYLPAAPVMMWMLPGVFFYALTGVISQYLASIGMPRRLVGIWTAAVVLSLAVGCWLIPAYSSQGAAMSYSLVLTVVFAATMALAWMCETSRLRRQCR